MKKTSVTLSRIEVEFITYCSDSCEEIWIRNILEGFFNVALEMNFVFCDNQSCVKLLENPVFHDKSKHIEIKYHHIRDMVQRGAVKL